MNTLTTPNMLEVAYLLERNHRIRSVATQASWPYGIEELAVTLTGEHIDLDHGSFLRHGCVSPARVHDALQQVASCWSRDQVEVTP